MLKVSMFNYSKDRNPMVKESIKVLALATPNLVLFVSSTNEQKNYYPTNACNKYILIQFGSFPYLRGIQIQQTLF